jgi:Domain of unknown function (DUF4365)
MPRRPDSHVVADLALNRVANICSECGWACETVHKDYGDDLLVQTNHFGLVDYNKIWIQVKGTRDISKMLSQKSGYSISVSLDHAFKWARSMDLVVVVLWDVEKDFGLWTLPKDGLDEWNWRNQKSQKIKLLFNKNSLFDAKQAKMIAWLARIDHYAALVSKARDRDVAYLSDDSIKSQGQHKSWTSLIAYDFLKLLFVLGNESVDSAFVESIKKMEGKLMDREVSSSQDDKKIYGYNFGSFS